MMFFIRGGEDCMGPLGFPNLYCQWMAGCLTITKCLNESTTVLQFKQEGMNEMHKRDFSKCSSYEGMLSWIRQGSLHLMESEHTERKKQASYLFPLFCLVCISLHQLSIVDFCSEKKALSLERETIELKQISSFLSLHCSDWKWMGHSWSTGCLADALNFKI